VSVGLYYYLMIRRGGLGRLVAWHLPDGPVGPASRWAATSKVEVGQTTYPANRGRVAYMPMERWERRERSEQQSHKERKREGGVERGRSQGP